MLKIQTGFNMPVDQTRNRVFKKSFWLAFAFYFFIGFEFFYMVSPFAVYFYSVYRPGLNFLNSHPILAWLSTIFLPHIVSDTKSWLLNSIMTVGSILILSGMVIFCIGASQVYYYKLTRKKVVTGGIYNFIRHPQYAGLAIAGLGLLILWPRYIALLAYITMLFFYYNLARFEEKECVIRFGESYLVYVKQTNMFFPVKIKGFSTLRILPAQGPGRYLGIIGVYAASCVLGILLANQLRDWSLDQIYALYTKDAVTISVTRLENKDISHLLNLAVQTPAVKQRLAFKPTKSRIKYLNYIVPTDWSASEVPMNTVENAVEIHGYPKNKKINQYKIVFTQSVQRNPAEMAGKNILLNTAGRIPLLEVVIDVPLQKVVQITNPVQEYRLDGVPLPLF
jgi:protein-S-isoprenylcysteine O-methyltransferase Ste14